MKTELTKEEFVAKYPVGTRILWNNRTGLCCQTDNWLPGVVIRSQGKRPKFAPCVWFVLDKNKDLEIAVGSRFIGYEYQHLIKEDKWYNHNQA